MFPKSSFSLIGLLFVGLVFIFFGGIFTISNPQIVFADHCGPDVACPNETDLGHSCKIWQSGFVCDGTNYGKPPSVRTDPASSINPTSADLNGAILPWDNFLFTKVWFRYREDIAGDFVCNDADGTKSSDVTFGPDTNEIPVRITVNGLLPNSTYSFCIIGENTNSGVRKAFNSVLTFTTLGGAVGTFSVGPISPTSATEGIAKNFEAPITVEATAPAVSSCAFFVDGVSQGGMVNAATGNPFSSDKCNPGTTCTARYTNYTFPIGSAGDHPAFAKCSNSLDTKDGSIGTITVTTGGFLAPNLISPVDGATGETNGPILGPLLTWSAVSGITWYKVELLNSANTNILDGIGDRTNINAPFLSDGTYRWRVASCQAGSSNLNCVTPAWSSYWTFTVAAPGSPVVTLVDVNPNPPNESQQVTFSAIATDPDGNMSALILQAKRTDTGDTVLNATCTIGGAPPNCTGNASDATFSSLAVGPFPRGVTIEYWAIAQDQALNSYEASHRTITVSGGGGGATTAPTSMMFQFRNPIRATSFTDLTNTLINFLFTLAVILAPILLVIAGVIFMTAAGEPGRVKTARSMLLWTIVGFGIILIAKGLVEVLKGILGI